MVELRAFLGALALNEDGPVSYTPEGLARLIEQVGPVLDIGDDGIEGNEVSHVRILTGVSGDGTPNGTTISYADPATGTAMPPMTFRVFDQLHGGTEWGSSTSDRASHPRVMGVGGDTKPERSVWTVSSAGDGREHRVDETMKEASLRPSPN
ncbi:papain-like cysteine protease family protein [Microbispora triticiradicis]|uniref:papain-like cysteine protease family protein n=1 Tax=Microbispora triticiradicis TaxID=2200763 RepID=UPI001AD6F76E|nr:papain-like cysteine protease family protein [Microbispora triticiradicis]MBO4274347.1 hypothetical protein [Microbispora triticiradicis]